jgi:hypothetical protein
VAVSSHMSFPGSTGESIFCVLGRPQPVSTSRLVGAVGISESEYLMIPGTPPVRWDLQIAAILERTHHSGGVPFALKISGRPQLAVGTYDSVIYSISSAHSLSMTRSVSTHA